MLLTKVKQKEIEEILYKYFITKKKLKVLENKGLILFKHKENIENAITNNDVKINADITAINYDKDNVQTSNDGTSYMEKALINEIDKLENEREIILKELMRNYKEIRELEKETVEMKYIISLLHEESKKFLILKYDELKSFEAISEELNMSKSAAVRENKKIISDIEKFLFTKAS